MNRLPLIKHFIENESENKPEEALYNLIIGFQDKIFSRQKGEKQQYVSSVLYYLYDKDILKEEFWLKYLSGNIQEKYNSIFRVEEGEKKLKEAAKDFSEWIENGPYEGEEENNEKEKEEKSEKKEETKEKENAKEEKDEDDNEEKGKKKGKKKKGKKKKDKEEKESKKDNKEVKEETKEENKEEIKEEQPKEENKEEKKEEKKEEEDINIDDI